MSAMVIDQAINSFLDAAKTVLTRCPDHGRTIIFALVQLPTPQNPSLRPHRILYSLNKSPIKAEPLNFRPQLISNLNRAIRALIIEELRLRGALDTVETLFLERCHAGTGKPDGEEPEEQGAHDQDMYSQLGLVPCSQSVLVTTPDMLAGATATSRFLWSIALLIVTGLARGGHCLDARDRQELERNDLLILRYLCATETHFHLPQSEMLFRLKDTRVTDRHEQYSTYLTQLVIKLYQGFDTGMIAMLGHLRPMGLVSMLDRLLDENLGLEDVARSLYGAPEIAPTDRREWLSKVLAECKGPAVYIGQDENPPARHVICTRDALLVLGVSSVGERLKVGVLDEIPRASLASVLLLQHGDSCSLEVNHAPPEGLACAIFAFAVTDVTVIQRLFRAGIVDVQVIGDELTVPF